MTDPITPPTPTPPAGAPPAPEPATPPTNGSPTPENGTPPASSPDDKPSDPPAPKPEKPEPTPEEVAAAARATVHEKPDAYQVNLDEASREALGLGEDDPLVAGLAKYAAEKGKPQGWMDDALEAAAEMAKAGLFDAGLDPAAEAAKLGENAAGRRREVEVFAEALKARNDGFDDEMFGELMSLSPTAAGIKTVEYLRKMMNNGNLTPPTNGGDPADAAKEEAKAMTADPRYGKDRRFTKEADAKWAAAFGGRI